MPPTILPFQENTMRLVSLIVLLGTILVASQAEAAFFGRSGSSMEKVTAKDGTITIDASKLPPMAVRHYRYQEGGQIVKFFVVRDGQGVVRTAVDACDVCWKSGKGYALRDGAMLCVNCNMRFALNRIGLVKGGCNPHPFRYTVENDVVAIAAEELMREGAPFFPENRR
jgi:uncharacterized membrane protein